jgi:hypothetical protein
VSGKHQERRKRLATKQVLSRQLVEKSLIPPGTVVSPGSPLLTVSDLATEEEVLLVCVAVDHRTAVDVRKSLNLMLILVTDFMVGAVPLIFLYIFCYNLLLYIHQLLPSTSKNWLGELN